MSDRITYDSLWRLCITDELTLPDGSTKTVVLRAIGREDARARRRMAREQANFARIKLSDPECDDYKDTFDWIGQASDESLEFHVRRWYSSVLASEAREEILLVEDSDNEEQPTTLVESLEKEEADAGAAELVERERERYVEDNIEARVAHVLADRSRTETLVRRILTEAYCLDVYNSAWRDVTLYYGVLNEDGSPFFGEIPANASPDLIEVLHEMYRKVDEGSYRPSS